MKLDTNNRSVFLLYYYNPDKPQVNVDGKRAFLRL